jgi:peptidoglycan/LPS O-acetylase OafA/YrhL
MDSVTSTGFHPTLSGWLRNGFLAVFFIDGHTSYNALLWTMKFEWFGSLLIFLLASLLPRTRWRLLVAAILLVCLAEVPTYAILYLFLAGMILHDLTAWPIMRGSPSTASVRRLLEFVGFLLVGFGLYLPRLIMVMVDAQGMPLDILLWLRQVFPSWQGDRWMVAAVPVVAGVLLSARLKCWLSLPLCQFLGRISFPLYLFHLTIILSLGSWLLLTLLPHMNLAMAACFTFVMTAAVALAVAWLMTYLVEMPTLRLAARFGVTLDAAWGLVRPWRRRQAAKGVA